ENKPKWPELKAICGAMSPRAGWLHQKYRRLALEPRQSELISDSLMVAFRWQSEGICAKFAL
ncbi:MAG: hypothetical protein WAV92_06720, partial [Halopseudomonas yangmingensis]